MPLNTIKSSTSTEYNGQSGSRQTIFATNNSPEESWVWHIDSGETRWSSTSTAKNESPKYKRVTNEFSAEEQRAAKFGALQALIARMAKLAPGQEYAVDQETSVEAAKVLNLLSAYAAEAPKVFSHGGDAVVFTWDYDTIKRYLTVVGDDVSLLDVAKKSSIQCEYDVDLTVGPAREEWLKSLVGTAPSPTRQRDVW